MPDAAPRHDEIEQANRLFWNAPGLDTLMADVAPLEPDERFEIKDLTDEEWQAFLEALDE